MNRTPTNSAEAEVDGVPEAVMEEARDLRHSDPQPARVVYLADPIGMLGRPNYLGTRQEIEAELDVVAVAIRAFHVKQPDQVMREVAAFSARLTELCVLLHRVENTDRQYMRLRTQQVDRFLSELDRQYRIASRMVEVMRQDLELSR